MSRTRGVLLGIAAAGMVTATSGCATVGLGDVLDAVGVLGGMSTPGRATASGYEMVPGREYVGPQMVTRLSLFGEADSDQCGVSLIQLWRPDPLGVGPRGLAGPVVPLWGSRASTAGSAIGVSQSGIGVLGPAVLGGGASAIGVRAQPLDALRQPLVAAKHQGGLLGWGLDYASCPPYPETPR